MFEALIPMNMTKTARVTAAVYERAAVVALDLLGYVNLLGIVRRVVP